LDQKKSEETMRIHRILCPTDLSLNSANGIVYAYSLALEHKAELVVLHVTTFPPAPLAALGQIDSLPLERPVYIPPTVDQILRRASARLDAFMRALVNSRCRTRVTLGKPTGEIITAALDERVDLIVMARRHMGFLGRIISPSVSEQVSRKAPCPVLSICPPKIQRPLVARSRPALTGLFAGAEA
jgi:nucleotide-binding universal stress UspA family protein